MNDYIKYKLKNLVGNVLEKFFDFLFYFPRQLYKRNNKFKNYIMNKESKSRKKRIMKKCLNNIFRDLDRKGSCIVLTETDYDNEFDFDRDGYDYRILLNDKKWIYKNKLHVKEYTLYNYIKTNYKEKLYMVSDFRKDYIVLEITRIGK